jgi:glyoxylate/hydroxypyruvate reductase A
MIAAMRIHLQNPADDPLFRFSREMWEEAVARAPDVGAGHRVSIGNTEQEFAAGMAEAEALISDVDTIKASFPEYAIPGYAPSLKLISATSAGLNLLAPFDWLPPGVTLLNNSGTHAEKAGEFALMSVLMLVNRIPEFVADQRQGRWRKLWGSVLRGRRVTVVGLGSLGGAAAKHFSRFGMQVTGVRTRAEPHPDCAEVIATGDMDRVLPSTEFLVLACPLTAATQNLLDRRRLGLLPPGAGLVNIGRGALLDQDALCDALDAGRIGGAVLDVFVPEPVPPGHRLWTTPNLIMSPHTSADDPNTYNADSLDIFFQNLRALRDGLPMPNRFDQQRGY